MADAYVIEVEGVTAGIVARDPGCDAFTFFSSHRDFHALEGKRFSAPWAATQAARRLIAQGQPRRRLRKLSFEKAIGQEPAL